MACQQRLWGIWMVAEHDRNLAKITRGRVLRWAKRASERTVFLLQMTVAVGGLIVVSLLSIPWLADPLKKAGLTAPGPFSQLVITLVLVSIFFEVKKLSERKPDPLPRHFADPMDVYPVLLDRVRATTRTADKTLDVLGLTLFTAWPSIRFWINRSDLNGWTMRFTAMAINNTRVSAHVPADWHRDARANLDSIRQYAKSSAASASSISVTPFAYDFMPSLHGYRLGNGDLFYSIVRWQADGKLSLDGFSYEFVPNEDHSQSAQAIREVFDSWFRRATVTEWSGSRSR
jgi:hypothetical protein